jgi:thioredoxin-dependent peroxiredoxin
VLRGNLKFSNWIGFSKLSQLKKINLTKTNRKEDSTMSVITSVPNVTFKTRVRDESVPGPNPYRWQDLSSDEIFQGKKVVLFSLPGAFTPTCSSNHLPRYEELYEEFQALGVDQIVCISVNDAFVMFQWGKQVGAKNVFLLPDGNGEFTRKMGMLVDKSNLGFGMRSWRYSMLVNDGQIEKIFTEPDFGDNCPIDPFEVSDADTMLAYLKGADSAGVSEPRLAFVG